MALLHKVDFTASVINLDSVMPVSVEPVGLLNEKDSSRVLPKMFKHLVEGSPPLLPQSIPVHHSPLVLKEGN